MPTLTPDRRRTIAAAVHPVVLSAGALVLVNDFVLRRIVPGWWTGKLSDAGWLVVAPVFVAAMLAVLGASGRVARIAGFVLAFGVFVTLQLWPPLGDFVNPRHVADAEDLLMLPALAGALVAWRRASSPALRPWTGAVALPALAGVLIATSWEEMRDASWPCGDGMSWDPADPLLIQFGHSVLGPYHDTDAFLRGLRLVDGAGREVPLVAADARASYGTLVCARDGLRGETDYTWTIGPWDEVSSNEAGWWYDGLPTVHFRTLPGEGLAVGDITGCAALAGTLDTGLGADCGIGAGWDTGRDIFDSGDSGDTDTGVP